MKEKIVAPIITFLMISALGLAGTTFIKSGKNELSIDQIKVEQTAMIKNVKDSKKATCLIATHLNIPKEKLVKICLGD